MLTVYTDAGNTRRRSKQMDKKYADKIVTEYMQKIFGFALSKLMNTDKAEELASRIIFDVYISLLKTDSVQNIDGYIYRVASNVYARFVDEEARGRYIALDEAGIICEHDFTLDFEKNEDYIRLRREISYLGKTQREIIVMQYFDRLKQNEIAKRLNIPLGTVKWHLHDARKQIKNKLEGKKMNENVKGTLGVKPVKLNMGMSGNAPDGKNTSYYLAKLISQNIAYSAYHEPKTITEIAEELGVSAAFIEDEVEYLEEYGFIDKVAGGKYQTNIFIREPSQEASTRKHELYKKYAKILRDKYVPLIFDALRDYKSKKIYSPEDDINFLMWSAVAYCCRNKLVADYDYDSISRYRVKRKDGGDYIALAWIDDGIKYSYDFKKYNVPNNMTRMEKHTHSWQLTSYYDSRTEDYMDNKGEDYEYLYEHITGKITKTPENADKYKRLFDKGYLVTKGDAEYVNMIISANSESDFTKFLPGMTAELKAIGDELNAEILKLETVPAHMQDLHRASCSNSLCDQNMVAYVFELLVEDGTLKPLTDAQKQSVCTIMFCDTLPQ